MTEPLACRERAVVFGRHSSLVGVLTQPTEIPLEMPVLVLGAGILHKIGPSRVSVELCREFARRGHPTLRFDLSGIGDSPRASEPSLEQAVLADIDDAITFLLESSEGWGGGVCLVGFCSGADNAFFVAQHDERVAALGLFDPTVHETSGFRRRSLRRRLLSARSWLNVLSGRSVWLRVEKALFGSDDRPPEYYGLLAVAADAVDDVAQTLVARGVRLLYVLSHGAQQYCNAPAQVRESMPRGYSPVHFDVRWCPELTHTLDGPRQTSELCETLVRWLDTAT